MTKLRRALRRPAVEAGTGMCRSEIYEAMQETREAIESGETDPEHAAEHGFFPLSFQLEEGGKAVGWWEDEIILYQESRTAARDAKRDKVKVG